VALGRVARLEHEHVGGELDEPLVVPRGVFEIDNELVAGAGRVDGEAGHADEPLVRPGVAERVILGERLAGVPAQPDPPGPCAAGAVPASSNSKADAQARGTRRHRRVFTAVTSGW